MTTRKSQNPDPELTHIFTDEDIYSGDERKDNKARVKAEAEFARNNPVAEYEPDDDAAPEDETAYEAEMEQLRREYEWRQQKLRNRASEYALAALDTCKQLLVNPTMSARIDAAKIITDAAKDKSVRPESAGKEIDGLIFDLASVPRKNAQTPS